MSVRTGSAILAVVSVSVLASSVAVGDEPGAGTAVTDKAFLDFAAEVERSLNEGDARPLDQATDVDALIARIVGGVKTAPEMLRELPTALRKDPAVVKPFGSMALALVGKSGSVTLLAVRELKGEKQAIFRIVGTEKFNYLKLALVKTSAGIRATDYMSYHRGEWHGAHHQRRLNAALGSPTGVEEQKAARQVQAHVNAKEHEKALAVYAKLPPAWRQDRWVLIARLAAAKKVGGDARKAALEDLVKWYGAEPSMSLIVHRALEGDERYALRETALGLLDGEVGGDAYITCERAGLLVEQGKKTEARDLARKAIAKDPKLPDPYWLILLLAADKGEYAEVIKTFEALEKAIGEPLDASPRALSQSGTGMDGFLKSKEYREWYDKRKKAGK